MSTETQDLSVNEAARWYARLNSPLCTAADRLEFEAWCREDAANERNFAAARRLAEDLFSTIAADDRLQAMADEALAASTPAVGRGAMAPSRLLRPSPAGPRRGWRFAVGLAACLVASIGSLVLVQRQEAQLPAAALFAAGSETRLITLNDGTRVHLDVRSSLEVRYSPERRDVVLNEGRAIFDVTRDPERPFAVATSLGVVTALGTRFEVRQADAMTVTLAEGSVAISGATAGDRREYLQPGEQLSIMEGRSDWIRRDVDVDAETGWSVGRLTFRNARLSDAVAQVNRYASAKIRIADDTLADVPISGSFVAGDSAAAAAAFAAVLPIRIADSGDELLLFRRWEPARP